LSKSGSNGIALASTPPPGWSSIAGYDAVVIATDHDAVDKGELVTHARLIVDMRNVCRRAGFDGPHIVAA